MLRRSVSVLLCCLAALLGFTPTANSQESSPAGRLTGSEQPGRSPQTAKIHDPSTILVTAGVARCLATGQGVVLLREEQAETWLPEGRLFAENQFPAWHKQLVPENKGHLWAPDVVQIGAQFFVYYSVSTFGKNTSAIGLVVGRSLDPASSEWGWEDRGPVITSGGGNGYNAIDPAIFYDAQLGQLWMSFGSFWEGIKLIELDPQTGLRSDPQQAPMALAFAPEIEAPFIHKRGDDYFLFVNWGKCCRGVNSTYEIRVGRSQHITGPYLDQAGVDLRQQGGTLVLASEGRWIGPGHASLLQREDQEWLVHHYYDREQGGRSKLRMVPLAWSSAGWPVVGRE